MTDRRKSKHVLLGSGAPYFIANMSEGQLLPRNTATTGRGYASTGGPGRALCSCGWFTTILETRQQRRDKWKEHYEFHTHPSWEPEWVSRNKRILELVQELEDEDPDEVEKPMFMTPAERALYAVVTPNVMKDLVSRYRRQK